MKQPIPEHVASLPYYARPSGDEKYYTIRGEPFVRVTHVLDCAPGAHLITWSAKQAALYQASLLYQAGLRPPEPASDRERADFEAVAAFAASRAELTREEALQGIFSWRSAMVEHERYRDHKGRIGSVAHHARAAWFFGEAWTRGSNEEIEGNLERIARDIRTLTIPDGTPGILTLIHGRELTGIDAIRG